MSGETMCRAQEWDQIICRETINAYLGPALRRGPGFAYLSPHPYLAPWISAYTVTCPATMPEAYTVLPTCSSTLVYSVDAHTVVNGLRGVNTRAERVGGHAGRFDLLLLIEFQAGGLYPLIGIPQSELLNRAVTFETLHGRLNREILSILYAARDLPALKGALDRLFLRALESASEPSALTHAKALILQAHGEPGVKTLSQAVLYSEKQLNRLFRRHIGTGVKLFSRVVRMNHAIRLLDASSADLTRTALAAGYYDQPHFIREFQALCGVSPAEYVRKKSLLYNDTFKL